MSCILKQERERVCASEENARMLKESFVKIAARVCFRCFVSSFFPVGPLFSWFYAVPDEKWRRNGISLAEKLVLSTLSCIAIVCLCSLVRCSLQHSKQTILTHFLHTSNGMPAIVALQSSQSNVHSHAYYMQMNEVLELLHLTFPTSSECASARAHFDLIKMSERRVTVRR